MIPDKSLRLVQQQRAFQQGFGHFVFFENISRHMAQTGQRDGVERVVIDDLGQQTVCRFAASAVQITQIFTDVEAGQIGLKRGVDRVLLLQTRMRQKRFRHREIIFIQTEHQVQRRIARPMQMFEFAGPHAIFENRFGDAVDVLRNEPVQHDPVGRNRLGHRHLNGLAPLHIDLGRPIQEQGQRQRIANLKRAGAHVEIGLARRRHIAGIVRTFAKIADRNRLEFMQVLGNAFDNIVGQKLSLGLAPVLDTGQETKAVQRLRRDDLRRARAGGFGNDGGNFGGFLDLDRFVVPDLPFHRQPVFELGIGNIDPFQKLDVRRQAELGK